MLHCAHENLEETGEGLGRVQSPCCGCGRMMRDEVSVRVVGARLKSDGT